MITFVESFQSSLESLATELAEILVEYPNSLPDEVCAVGEEAELEVVQGMFSEMLAAGQIDEIEEMLRGADDEREQATNESEGEGEGETMSKSFNESWEEWEAAKRNVADAVKATPVVKAYMRFCYWLIDHLVIWIDRFTKKESEGEHDE